MPAARLRRVTKQFGAVTALDQVGFGLAPGEIHGLLGENGAGKTTLALVLAGLLSPDAGRVEIGGRPFDAGNAAAALRHGVAMVHQHFSLVPRFTGLENIALFNRGAWTRRGAPAPGYRTQVERRARELKLDVDLDVPVQALGVGSQQRVEILKALMSETRVLLLDEPTAVLAPPEVEGLFAVLRRVATAGTGIVLAAHKLDEILGVADRVTVLRKGKRILTKETRDLPARELVRAMVGDPNGSLPDVMPAATPPRIPRARSFGPRGSARSPNKPAPVASLANVTVADVTTGTAGRQALRKVDLTVHRGEVLGIAGVEGNGQRELAAVLAGVRRPDSGTVVLPGEIGWIPQDRTREGLMVDFSILENVALALHQDPSFRKGPWLDWAEIERRTATLTREMDVRIPRPGAAVRTLSGGNQQRVLVGREFLRGGDLLVAESPTRGLDVRATQAVRTRMAELVRTGNPPPGIVLISADLDEVLDLSDRIAVLVGGRLVPAPPGNPARAAIGKLMLSTGKEAGREGETGANKAKQPARGKGA